MTGGAKRAAVLLAGAALAWVISPPGFPADPGASEAALIHDPIVAPAVEAGRLKPYLNPRKLYLQSSSVVVVDGLDGTVLYGKNVTARRPIASLTKLMTAMVTLDECLSESDLITIDDGDRDRLRYSKSRLRVGMTLTRLDLLRIALAASDNRAASALARSYPGGREAFVGAMNAKAAEIGLTDTVFRDPSGLHSGNLSTAADLARLVDAASDYSLIRSMTTTPHGLVTDRRTGREVRFVNTNRLVRGRSWDIGLSKTGFIADAGHCLVMLANVGTRPVVMVLLGSWGELSRFGDANRVKNWLIEADRRALSGLHFARLTP